MCYTGDVSGDLAQELQELGYEAYSLDGRLPLLLTLSVAPFDGGTGSDGPDQR